MFWRRTTGHGAFWGFLSGTVAAAVHHGLTLPEGAVAGVKGGYLGVVQTFRSEMGQTFWTAIFAWTTCFVVTILVSMLTRPRPDEELVGLVYALTPRPASAARAVLHKPAFLGIITMELLLDLNLTCAEPDDRYRRS